MQGVKKRNWALVAYPESLPEDWRDMLVQTGLAIAISPLHDRDLDPTGEPKKAHYHLILCYPGPQTYNAVKTLADSLHCPIPQPLDSIRGYYRYFTHKDNPEKAQYQESDITTLNGWNLLDYQDLTRSELQAQILEIHTLVLNLDILEYSDLLDYLRENGQLTMYEVASTHTILFQSYLASRRHKRFGYGQSGHNT